MTSPADQPSSCRSKPRAKRPGEPGCGPWAVCPSCGAAVFVIPVFAYEFFAHRRPNPDGSMCDPGRRAHVGTVLDLPDSKNTAR